jgi:4-azaleucine resistance transporter AzlC
LAGVRRTLPLAVSTIAFGLVLGVLARQAGLSLLDMAMMSALVFAGASQFIAVGLWVTPLPALTIIVTTLVVNLRHVLMGAALRPWLSKVPAPKAYGLLYFLTDETWALTIQELRAGGRDLAFMLGSGVTLFVSWVSSTSLGLVIGAAIQSRDISEWGLDFVFTAVFTALLVAMWKGKSDLLPWVVAGAVALGASLWLPGKWYILLGGLAGSLVGAMRDGK